MTGEHVAVLMVSGAAVCAVGILAFRGWAGVALRSENLQLIAGEYALLQLRHNRFCDGSPPLRVEMWFSPLAGEPVSLRKSTSVDCREFAQLRLPGPAGPVQAVVRLPRVNYVAAPVAELRVVRRDESGRELERQVPLRRTLW